MNRAILAVKNNAKAASSTSSDTYYRQSCDSLNVYMYHTKEKGCSKTSSRTRCATCNLRSCDSLSVYMNYAVSKKLEQNHLSH